MSDDKALHGGLRDLDSRTIGGLFLALVAAILGAVPGWETCFLVWLALAWFLMLCALLATLILLAAAGLARDWFALRLEARQMLSLTVFMLLAGSAGQLSTWVELAQVRSGLRTQANASARVGGPRVAVWTEPDDPSLHGFLYDDDREIERPPARRSIAWSASEAGLRLTGNCTRVRHVVGPYYRWSNDCGEL